MQTWVIAAILGGIFPIFTNGASQAIWQAKVAPDVQGRVFSARNMFATLMSPLAFGLLFFLLTILPVLQVIPIGLAAAAD